MTAKKILKGARERAPKAPAPKAIARRLQPFDSVMVSASRVREGRKEARFLKRETEIGNPPNQNARKSYDDVIIKVAMWGLGNK
jgi:hypothetical protein